MLQPAKPCKTIHGSIAVDSDIVFAQDAQGFLYAIDTETGKLCWEKQLPVNGLPALLTDWWPVDVYKRQMKTVAGRIGGFAAIRKPAVRVN